MNARAKQAAVTVSVAAGLLGAIGFAVSFERVSAAARPSFGALAPAVPVGVDLGILVFSAAGLLLAWFDMPARWLRLVPVGLTAATVAMNVAGERDLFGRVAHATLPCLWVLAVAIAEHVVRHRLALDTGRRMDAVRLSRWLLAPTTTLRLWRRMVLWETRSYVDALGRERGRLLAVAALRDTYGPLWRVKAPRRLRVAYRLGDLDPEHVRPTEPRPARKTPAKLPPRKTAGAARSMDELRAELATAITSGRLKPKPSAEAIRKALACSPTRARQLRDDSAGKPLALASSAQEGAA